MAEVRLTKSSMREQQTRLAQLEKYLPTLQLKKAMLQAEITAIRQEIERLQKDADKRLVFVEESIALWGQSLPFSLADQVRLDIVEKRYENIAGVEVPYIDRLVFHSPTYSLYSTPGWVDRGIIALQELVRAKIEVDVAKERSVALEKELRDVTIRVNLFEKRLIPQAQQHIKKIKIFLGDQQLAEVSRAKVTKNKRGKVHAH